MSWQDRVVGLPPTYLRHDTPTYVFPPQIQQYRQYRGIGKYRVGGIGGIGKYRVGYQ
jgi:hypothetical protein